MSLCEVARVFGLVCCRVGVRVCVCVRIVVLVCDVVCRGVGCVVGDVVSSWACWVVWCCCRLR